MQKIIDRIMAGYESAFSNLGEPRVFCSGNPNRCFVTWTTGARPEGYARIYVRNAATPEERARLGIVSQPVRDMFPQTARTIIRERQEKQAQAANPYALQKKSGCK